MSRPDPTREIRLLGLHTLRGANYWASRPITRLDLAVGAYEELSSAEVPGLVESLVGALPGLVEHRCSVGERYGFITRLRRGTYAPHIVEHVALELQSLVGHEVGYGRTRGHGDPGEYVVAFEHRHAEVGRRAAVLALEIVQRAFAGSLDSAEHAVRELESCVRTPDFPPLRQRVLCGITGGGLRAETREQMVRRGLPAAEVVVEVAPAYILNAGLPYARSEIGIIMDSELSDVPDAYQEPDRARRLMSVIADAVAEDGLVIVPAHEWELQEIVRDAGCRVAVFSADGRLPLRDARLPHAAASVQSGQIELDCHGEVIDAGALDSDCPPGAQVAAALAMHALADRYA